MGYTRAYSPEVMVSTGKGGIGMFKIIKLFSNANIPRTIRFTEELFDELNNVAQKNGISFNLLVLQCYRYALDQLQQEQK